MESLAVPSQYEPKGRQAEPPLQAHEPAATNASNAGSVVDVQSVVVFHKTH